MALPLFHVDSFTSQPFAGNPAGVCLLDAPREAEWMQRVAAELRLPETSFLVPAGEAWSLRWFTPEVEVALCGHGTLAAAHVLWETGRLDRFCPARFDTRSGRLCAGRGSGERIGPSGRERTTIGPSGRERTTIILDLPARPQQPAEVPGLAEALGVRPAYVGRNAAGDVLALLDDVAAVKSLHPDFAALSALEARAVIVTAAGGSTGYDFVSRFFAPKEGVDEDPVTGSAHCCLGPFWVERLGKPDLRAFQASPRGGALGVRVRGGRVFLSGEAVTVARGELVA